ncbi:DUF4097 domain-containing protein [candidate division KSB1 bacterium]|nr:DUF4097 domain-containing protein [candidate division KSB1 bacterium]NIR68662.1 DUF4097 domain-containing protein [candidate division KSB1 bacterium]NIS27151.1 DUF4097 domain-containing protein [candidate division KSB1 bacterium]NIT74037.1 DUF4097 domain-containing protein [candidate division KSB1 bacterium]NIU27903.1 DUF4097 domain-containing protein [candidate division KSB1 bacterium]
MKFKLLPILAVCQLLFAQSGFGGKISKVEEHTFKLKPGARVTVIGDDGQVLIKGWDKDEAYVKITKRVWERDKRRAEEIMEELEVEIDHRENRLFIREVDLGRHRRSDFWELFDPDRWEHRAGYEIDYELNVPNELDLRVENDEGDVEISNLSGRLRLKVDEGEIMLNTLSSVEVDVGLDEGELLCKNIRGNDSVLFLQVDEGTIRVVDCKFEEVDLKSDEGDFIINNLKVKRCELRTDEADIEAELEFLAGGRCKIRTDEGDINLILPENIDARFRLDASDGRIRSDFPLSIKSRNRGERVDESLGEGLVSIDIFTEDADIILEKK